MTDISHFLNDRRKAELQTIHQFWFPGEAMLTKRNILEERIAAALGGNDQVAEGVSRLNRVQQAFLLRVLAEPNHAAACRDVHDRLETDGTPSFEIENAGRMLQERGFLGRFRQQSPGPECYLIPDELALRLEELFQVGVKQVEPADQLSQKRLPFEIDFEGQSFAQRVRRLGDPLLKRVIALAIENQGLVCEGTLGVQELLDGDAPEGPGRTIQESLDLVTVTDRTRSQRTRPQCGRSGRPVKGGSGAPGQATGIFPARWQQQLEEAGIGTVGSVSLSDFGIVIGQPAVIIFQEWVQIEARDRLKKPPQPDTVVEAGIDLYIDLDRVASEIDDGLRLTRGEALPKRVHDALQKKLHLARIENFLDGDIVDLLMGLAQGIGTLERYAGRIEVHGERLQVWRKLELTRQVRMLLERFLDERRGVRWSFHQEVLRRIFIESLEKHVKEEWVPLDALINLVVSTYLLELEEREVRESLRDRREEDFARERLQSPFARLGQDLVYWLVNRLMLLGVCELGYSQGKLVGFRLTALGKETFGIKRRPRESRLLVNPDLEVMLISEGLRGMHIELGLARFAERVSSEQVRRYRLTRESVRRGIRSGQSLREIEEHLRSGLEHPLPEAVTVALSDWGKDLDWVEMQPTVVFSGLRRARASELSQRLNELNCQHSMCEELVVIHPHGVKTPGWEQILAQLRGDGWLFREPSVSGKQVEPS